MTALTCFKNKFSKTNRNNYREEVKIKQKMLGRGEKRELNKAISRLFTGNLSVKYKTFILKNT